MNELANKFGYFFMYDAGDCTFANTVWMYYYVDKLGYYNDQIQLLVNVDDS